MKLTLINGSLKEQHGNFDKQLEQFKTSLSQSSEKENLDYYNLKLMDIKQCIGCFQCWTKTPGKCAIKDDAEEILISVINSDLVIFASPLVMGMTTGLMKRSNDRLIPLIHPYFSIVKGEIHHRKRYDRYPKIAVIYEPTSEDTQEDIALCKEIYQRLAINFKTSLQFFKTIQEVEGGISL
ncbi:MAG: NAD(P)H-dependent oxidoreductase [Thermotogota bacterium]|nr:NAD(P)H-dependent oxidoreductase [Thermotogota bacterium]